MTHANERTAKVLVVGVLAAIGCGSSLPTQQTGTGGAGGVAGAGGGVAAACGTHPSFGTRLHATTVGPQGGVYEGPATIERSWTDELVIAFQPSGMTTPMHAMLTGADPLPVLTVGAQVWLSKNPAGDPVDQPIYYPPPSWSVAVRDAQGGRLLIGAAYNPTGTIASPVPLGNTIGMCTTTDPDGCNSGGKITYSTVDVLGDATVTIADGQTATVAIGGVDYDVRISAAWPVAGPSAHCGDWQPIGGVAVDARPTATSSDD